MLVVVVVTVMSIKATMEKRIRSMIRTDEYDAEIIFVLSLELLATRTVIKPK